MENLINTNPEVYFTNLISDVKGFAIFLMDRNGIITSWNKGCETMKGYSPEEAIGQHYQILFPDFLRDQDLPQKELEEAYDYGRYETVNWRRRNNGELFWAYVVLTKIVDDEGNFVGYAKITQDHSEMKRLESENEKKMEELRSVNADLDNFVYIASHDLKAPLNNIEGLIVSLEEELSEEIKSKRNVKEVMDMIRISVEKFRSIIVDMAVAARVDKEDKKFPDQSFIEIIEEIKVSLAEEIRVSGAKLYEEVMSAPMIKYSRKNVRSILYNLISNAIKYRVKGRVPQITIHTEKVNEFLLLKVSDNGIGIKEEDKPNVFSLYHRLPLNGNNSDIEGTGVGMAIVAKIVDTNGGRIEIDSEPGKGSIFKVYLKV